MQHTKDTTLVQSDIAKTSNPKSDQAIKSSLDRFKQMNWPELHGFLAHIYGNYATDIWVAGFADMKSASWGGVRGLDALEARGLKADAADLYFCIGPMAPGATRRNLGDVVAQPVLIVDDIGTKVDAAKWQVLFALGFPEPTFRIETSPNNQTWGWKLAGDPSTPERFAELALIRAWLVEKGLTDNVMDEARYVRLPGGWNSKEKYRPAGAPVTASPPVGLVGSVRSEDVSIDDIGRVLLARRDWRDAPMPAGGMNSQQLGAALGAGALRRTADMNNPDPLLQLAQVIGLNPVQIRGGVVEALCPNAAAHGDRAETGFAFLGGGLAQCQHASCQHLRSSDFRHLMVTAYDSMIAARMACGMDLNGLPASAQEFLAYHDFARHGAIVKPGDTGASSQVVTLANNIAARLADAHENAAAANGTVLGRSAPAFELAAKKILDGGGRLFTDQRGGVWLKYGSRLMNVSGKDARLFQLARHLGENLTATARNSFIETLLNRVEPDAPREHVGYRQAEGNIGSDPVIYVNRMDGANGIEVTRVGWRNVPLSSIPQPMADRQGGLAMPQPDSNSVATELMPLLERHLPLEPKGATNSANDKGLHQRAVILCLLASSYWRPGTVPHLMIKGQQGSGKTTLAKRLMDLLDADVAAITPTLPKNAGDMFAVVSGRGAITIDNAGGITKATSDALCALASGNAYAGRKLYSDADRSIMVAKSSVIFTSVLSDIVKQPDLAQRTLQFEPSPINRGARRGERDMDAAWAADLPKLFGALFSALSGMLEELSAVEADVKAGSLQTPRLHDAAIAAEAMARAIGWPPGECMAALLSAETSRAGDLLEDNPVAWRIRKFVQSCPNGEWEGTFGELHMAIQYISAVDAPAWDQKRVPFSGQYQRLWPDLELAWGIKRTLGRSNKTRTIRLTAPKPLSE